MVNILQLHKTVSCLTHMCVDGGAIVMVLGKAPLQLSIFEPLLLKLPRSPSSWILEWAYYLSIYQVYLYYTHWIQPAIPSQTSQNPLPKLPQDV